MFNDLLFFSPSDYVEGFREEFFDQETMEIDLLPLGMRSGTREEWKPPLKYKFFQTCKLSYAISAFFPQ